MIPLTLKISNFLSYGSQPQTINFQPYKLICLSGKNGHGKSALLDALTWALWGQARKISLHAKPDQGLVHLGQVEMMVSLDFIFNNQKYRVKRDFSQKYGKPHTHVEFGMLDENTDRFISLTEKTIRKTQEKIEQTIGLDYDTFINTCFLRQGQSNEFSKKSPKERKDILGNILGLNHYEKTRKVILESIKELQQKIDQCAHIQERIDKEIETLLLILAHDQDIKHHLEELSQQKKTLEYEQEKLQLEQRTLMQKEEEHKVALEQHKTTTAHYENLIKTLRSEIDIWRARHKKIIEHHSGESNESYKKELENRLHELQKKIHESLQIKNELISLKTSITSEEERVKKNLSDAVTACEKEKNVLETKKQFISEQIETAHKQIAHKQETIQRYHKEIDQLFIKIPSGYLLYEEPELFTVFERHKTLYKKWVERANNCKSGLTENHHKQELSDDADNPSCPLCEQNLSQARKRFLQKKLEDEQLNLTHRFNRLKHGIIKLKEHLHQEHAAYLLVKEKTSLTHLLSIITEEFTKETQALNQLQQAYSKIVQEEELKINELHALTTQITEEIEKNPTLINLRLQEKHHLQALAEYESLYKTYVQAQETLTALSLQAVHHEDEARTHKEQSNRIYQLRTERRKTKMGLSILSHSLKGYTHLTEEKNRLESKIHSHTLQEKAVLAQMQEYTEKRAVIVHAQEKKVALEQEKSSLEEQKKTITLECIQEQSLATAFSKDGIQALLIEEALPEIEYQANTLLGKLTDNQAHISIESLRDLKKGGTRETLDINISDAQGVRPYELFSGGEAFRIDFALRIAISKLLAQRAGTSLQTLIIDEGFGSQDDEGLQRIMDALYTIQDDFEKIIIVSHLSTLKEQFPVHFVVHKQPQGSNVTVFENH